VLRASEQTVPRGRAETLVVGRNEACDLVFDDKKISAVHLELVATERGVRVRDLGSRNGTFPRGHAGRRGLTS